MSSTWATRLANGDGLRLRFYAKVQGVPYVFHDSPYSLPTALEASTYTRVNTMRIPIQEGAELDLARRRVIGGSLTLMIDETSSGTLAALFAPRTRPTCVIGAAIDDNDTTVTVDSTTDLDTAGTAWVGAETITWTGKTATTLTTVTRGAFGSKAQEHRIDSASTTGEPVFEVPPWWYGRRVYLYGYMENLDGTTSTDLRTQLGTFSIERNPEFDAKESCWILRCSDLVDEVATKKLGRGIRPAALDGQALLEVNTANDTYELALEGDALNRFVEGGSSATTFGLLTNAGGGYTLHRLNAVGASSVEFDPGNRLNEEHPAVATASGAAVAVGAVAIGEVRHVALLEGHPHVTFLQAATSIIGDEANGNYDHLPGRKRDDIAEESWFFGAGIPESEVDVATIEAIPQITGFSWPIFAEHDFALLAEEICRRLGMFWYVTRAGLLSLKRLEAGAASGLDVDSSVIFPGTASISFDEEAIHPVVDFECQYDPIADRFDRRIVVTDLDLRERYINRAEPLDLQRRALMSFDSPFAKYQNVVVSGEVLTREAVHQQLRDVQVTESRGRARVKVTCGIRAYDVNIGDVVTLTVALPDLEGASSITSRRSLVIGTAPDHEHACVTLTLMLLEQRIHRIAPAAVIQSEAGDTLTLRVNSATFPEASGADPGDMFPVGASVRCWDISAATSQVRTVLAATTTTIQLSSALTFAGGVQADVDYVTLSTQPANDTSDSANGYSVHDFLFQMAGGSNTPPGGASNRTRIS
jgi:hypothetical protein